MVPKRERRPCGRPVVTTRDPIFPLARFFLVGYAILRLVAGFDAGDGDIHPTLVPSYAAFALT